MELNETLKAEAAARAAGGVVLGSVPAMPVEAGPQDQASLMKLAAVELTELRGAVEYYQRAASTTANLLACMMTKIAEVTGQTTEDGELGAKIDKSLLERANGARVRVAPLDDEGMAVFVTLPENFEKYDAAHSEDEAAKP